MENALPRTWSLCMTSENHGTVGPAGCKFSHAPEKHERVQVVEIVAAGAAPVAEPALPEQAAPLPAGLVRIADIPRVEITLRQAKELVSSFGGHDAEISVFQRPAVWTDMPDGLYAFFSDYPDEGSMYLGPTDVDDDLAMNGEPQPTGDALDAARYRWMRDRMSFIAGQLIDTTMSLRAPIPAPDHDPHKDWVGERFDASVDRAIDAAMQASTSGERQEGGA